jgi:hypothetical protein
MPFDLPGESGGYEILIWIIRAQILFGIVVVAILIIGLCYWGGPLLWSVWNPTG